MKKICMIAGVGFPDPHVTTYCLRLATSAYSLGCLLVTAQGIMIW